MRYLIYFTCWLVAFSAVVYARSPVWKVTKGSQTLYLGGTCHLLRTADSPLPAEFDYAYAEADKLVFEADPASMEDPQAATQLIKTARYTDGRSLKDVLSPKAYSALAEQGRKSGLPIAMLNGFKPGMAVMMVSLQELTKIGVTQEGVDMIYAKRAKKDGKPIHSLETAAFQIEMITSLGEGLESEFVLYSLHELEQIETYFETLSMMLSWPRFSEPGTNGSTPKQSFEATKETFIGIKTFQNWSYDHK